MARSNRQDLCPVALISLENEQNGGVNGGIIGGVIGGVKLLDERLLDAIKKSPGINTPVLVQQLGESMRTIQRHLKTLCDKNEIEFRGAPKTGGYWKINTKDQ
jgi:ATP-dependent DNA helicase RecG